MSFDVDDLMRKIRGHVEDAANEHLATKAKSLQAAFDGVHAAHAGDPVETVHEALEAELVSCAVELPFETIRTYAEAIAEGRHVRVEFKPVDL